MSNVLKTLLAGTDPLASDVNQLIQALSAIADIGQLSLCPLQVPPIPPTLTTGSAGNLNGTYYYIIVLITGWQENNGNFRVNGFCPSSESTVISVTNSQVNLTGIPTGKQGTIGRAIYRTKAGGASGSEQFAGIIWDNTTTSWTDNIADTAIGTGMPTSSSTPGAYGTAIPAAVPTSNTTGSTLDAAFSYGQNLAPNGYIVLPLMGGPNGSHLILQWANSSISATGGVLVTLPMAFPTVHLWGLATRYNAADCRVGYCPQSLSQAKIYSDTVPVNIQYLAIGY